MPSFLHRIGQLVMLTVLAMGMATSFGRADLVTLSMDNASDNSFQFVIVPLAGISTTTPMSGNMVVDVTRSGDEVTEISFVSADITIGDFSVLENVNFFTVVPGELGVSFTGVHFSVAGGPFPVSGGFFNPAGLTFTFNQGTLGFSIDSAVTGFIPGSVDFSADARQIIADVNTRDGNAFSIDNKLQLFLPLDIASEPVTVEGFNVFLGITASLSTAIPEASSMILAGSAVIVAAGVAVRRRS